MPTLVIRGPDGAEQEQELSAEVTIGRADNNDVILTSGGVSRRHARIYLDDGQVVVEDSGSANGTFLDGQKIKGPKPLGAATKLSIGDYTIRLKGGSGVGAGAGGRPKSNPKPQIERPAGEGARPTNVAPALGAKGGSPT